MYFFRKNASGDKSRELIKVKAKYSYDSGVVYPPNTLNENTK